MRGESISCMSCPQLKVIPAPYMLWNKSVSCQREFFNEQKILDGAWPRIPDSCDEK